MGKIDTGSAELDEVLEWEAELKGRAFDMLDNDGLDTVVAFLCRSMNASSAQEALWKMAGLVGQPEPPAGEAPKEDEGGLVLEKYSTTLHDFVSTHGVDQDPEEIVELLVESIDGANTRDILVAMDA